MIRNTILTATLFVGGLLVASQSHAQTQTKGGQVQLIQLDLDAVQEMTGMASDDYSLIGGEEHLPLGEKPHHIGKDVNVTCGFCGTSDDDDELPFDASKTNLWDGSIEVYPNPATDHFYIRGGAYLLDIQLLTMDGRLVRQVSPTANAIQLDGLPAGVYLLRMDAGDKVEVKKLVVQ